MKDDLAALRREIYLLKSESRKANAAIDDLYNNNKTLVTLISKLSDNYSDLLIKCEHTLKMCINMPYELLDPNRDKDKPQYPIIKSIDETIEIILKERKSLSRFGDGEFEIINMRQRWDFQRVDAKLAERLKAVLRSKCPDLLVAVFNAFGSLENYNLQAVNAIRNYMTTNNSRMRLMELLEDGKVYYDAYITRPYLMYKDNATDAPRARFEALKQLWKDRDVIFIEGCQTRLGVGNDLFKGAHNIKRILAPAKSAFDRYNDLLDAALKHGEKDTLFLLALGPTATVLAYDLTINGFQALDIGHVDLEYEWFLAGKGERVLTPYKYCNEIIGSTVEELKDPFYESQIIGRYY